ncbi:MAG: nucleotidyl transferase AbiEii/AbiGii toxin family protein [Bryobacterales bacterium]
MDFQQVRKLTIRALVADGFLFQKLVLKGGNAIALVHQYGSRTSLDIDFSLEQDFEDIEEVRERIVRALKGGFASVGLVVFDEEFGPRPQDSRDQLWGGYQQTFKLIEVDRYEALKDDSRTLRTSALATGPGQKRAFTIDFSKHEYCSGKVEREIDHSPIYVYTPEMIVIEKLRAICQQMPEYGFRKRSTARARDFYDIHELVSNAGVTLNSDESKELARRIFECKHVPLSLIGKIAEHREFHRPDWPSVQDSVRARVESFDFYFDFVAGFSLRLETLWNV